MYMSWMSHDRGCSPSVCIFMCNAGRATRSPANSASPRHVIYSLGGATANLPTEIIPTEIR